MSEQIKTDFARAQKFIKAEQYSQAITILQPHKDHPRIAALIADLEAKRKPKGERWMTIIWITIVVIVAAIAVAVGYSVGVRQIREEYEIPQSFEDTFVASCTANTDVTSTGCAELIRSDWRYYQAAVIECYGLIREDGSMNEGEFLGCIVDVRE